MGPVKRLLAPRIPVHRLMRMLYQIGTLFMNQPIVTCMFLLFGHNNKPLLPLKDIIYKGFALILVELFLQPFLNLAVYRIDTFVVAH